MDSDLSPIPVQFFMIQARSFDGKLTGKNVFNKNGITGLVVDSYGTVTISNLTASYNNLAGVLVNNSTGTLPKPVNLTGYILANSNLGSHGLQISSRGAVTLVNVTATNNGSTGLDIYNRIDAGQQFPVTLKGTNFFNKNGSNGLNILSYGRITLSNVMANNNIGIGANLLNNSGTLAQAITLSGVNMFNTNTDHGLYFVSDGVFTIGRVAAINNGGNGIFGQTAGNINANMCTLVTGNTSAGVNLSSSSGTVTLKSLYSAANGTADVFSVPNVITRKICQ